MGPNLIPPWVYDTLFHSKLWPTHHLVLADGYTVMISSVTVYAAAKPNINTLCMKTYVVNLSFVCLGDLTIVQALNPAIQSVL